MNSFIAENMQIVAFRPDGLGSRLSAILNAMFLSKLYNRPYRILWQANATTEKHYPDFSTQHLFHKDYAQKHLISSYPDPEFQCDGTPGREWINRGGSYPQRNQLQDITLFTERTSTLFDCKKASQAHAANFRKIKFNSHIQETMDSLQKKLSAFKSKNRKIIAVHIRRGDVRTNPYWRFSYSKSEPDTVYEHTLKKLLKSSENNMVMLFCDTPSYLHDLTGKFPGLIAASDLFEAHYFPTIESALLELFLMSLADEIIAPEWSGFSMVPAAIGRTPKVTYEDIIGTTALYQMRTREALSNIEQACCFQTPLAVAGASLPAEHNFAAIAAGIHGLYLAVTRGENPEGIADTAYLDMIMQHYDPAPDFAGVITNRLAATSTNLFKINPKGEKFANQIADFLASTETPRTKQQQIPAA